MKQAIKISGKFVQLKEFDELPNDAPPFWTDEKNEIMRQYYPTEFCMNNKVVCYIFAKHIWLLKGRRHEYSSRKRSR